MTIHHTTVAGCGTYEQQKFKGVCSCKWEGPPRNTFARALDDGDDHVVAISRSEP